MVAMQWLRQLFHRDYPRIPDRLWQDSVLSLPFLQRLPPQDLERLKSLTEALLARKTFTGAARFDLTNEVAVMIAVQAALPVLNLTLDLYADMAGIIVYPAAFVIPQSELDEAGVVHEWHEPATGEAIDVGGAVVLSWEDVQQHGAPGYNVVIHEFAHKIDMGDGHANGCPPFLAAYHQGIDPRIWQQAFSEAFADFVRRVDELEARLPEDFDDAREADAAMYDELFAELPVDPYAARHPAEFFAVASEAFFVLPQPLAEDYPEIYRLLAAYYRQDPLQA
ncbi:MAG TPA: M90 family metallopeptidase [Noviherbaspirillum sp.]|uniref:M90 family metallopeptidase n=1 Tax=Noviherbaspirillum sp. TaxID=1926288 RepID=UPI002B47C531|nr:M90 family metallopeptidase [Noviherbaspirillum sp.]HJV85454.1 M90 family metallopeptidase [Noviherbaspirillum sp.]